MKQVKIDLRSDTVTKPNTIKMKNGVFVCAFGRIAGSILLPNQAPYLHDPSFLQSQSESLTQFQAEHLTQHAPYLQTLLAHLKDRRRA
jgi:hypothetical protein